MFYINETQLIETESKNLNAKSDVAKTNPIVDDAFKQIVWNIIDQMGAASVYELSHWTANQSRWIRSRNKHMKVRDFDRSSIVMVDLGATNFGYEFSFVHPAVVISQTKDYVYIAPCSSSSKKLSSSYPELIKATAAADGFRKDTAIIMNNTRWVHKNRVLRAVGKVSNRVLDEIDKHMLRLVPTHKKDETLKTKLVAKEKALESKEKEFDELKKEAAALKQTQQFADMFIQFMAGQDDLYDRFLSNAKQRGHNTVDLEAAVSHLKHPSPEQGHS